MSKTAFLFSGQGSQYVGMGQELASLSAKAREVFECAGDITGLHLLKICETASPEELAQTEISQPAIMATSLAALACIQERELSADGCAGHSLGEYAAMVYAGILTMEDGFAVIKERARAMSDCSRKARGSMCAIMGADEETLLDVCSSVTGYVVPVNYNTPTQTVIAGEEAAVDQAIERFSKLGKKAIKLAVSAAFHSQLMAPAAKEYQSAIASVPFHEPQAEFYSNVTGDLLTDVSDMPAYLAKHLMSPVQFVKELNKMYADDYDTFVELGPGKTLTSFVKKTIKGVAACNIENEKTLAKAVS